MDTLRLLATLFPLAVSSGINLYATILVAGLCIRMGWVQNVPSGLDVLASWPVLIVAAVFFAVEFLADKIPFVDNAWDLIHTVIRPLGAAVIALAALGHTDPALVVIASMATGSVALASHAGKAGSRIALNVASPAENVSNIGLSLGEDIFAGLLTVTALKYPWVAGGIALVLLVVMALLVPRLLSWAWFMGMALFAWLRGGYHRALGHAAPVDSLPPEHAALLGNRPPDVVARCKAQAVRGAGGRTGYLSLVGRSLTFTYRTLSGDKAWHLDPAGLVGVVLRHRVLVEVVEVRYLDDRRKERTARFAFMKDRGPLAGQIAARLGGVQAGPSLPPGAAPVAGKAAGWPNAGP